MKTYTQDEIAAFTATPAALGRHVGEAFIGRPYKVYPWVLYLEQQVLSMLFRPGPEILIVSVPPQEGKSTWCSMLLPAWYLGRWPDRQVINVSYNETQAGKWGLRTRNLMRMYGQSLFGVHINPDSDSATDWKMGQGFGGMMSVGIRGGITGNPGDLIVLDDTLKGREEANSPTIKRKNIEEYTDSITTRFQNDTKVLIPGTRWCDDDLPGEISDMASKLDYEGFPVRTVNIKAIAEPDPKEAKEMTPQEREEWRDCLGRREGEHLKGQHNRRFFTLKRASTPKPRWMALHQGTPTSGGEGMFPEEHWRFWVFDDYDGRPPETVVLPELVKQVRMWDLAASQGAGDWTVGQLMGRSSDGRIFVKEVVRERLAPGGVEALVIATAKRDGYGVPIRIERERSGAGISVVDYYKRHKDLMGYDVDDLKAEGDKTQRATPWSNVQNNHLAFLPQGAEWIDRYTGNHALMDGQGGLPKYDDEIDTAAYGCSFLLGSGESHLFDISALGDMPDLTDEEKLEIQLTRVYLGLA